MRELQIPVGATPAGLLKIRYQLERGGFVGQLKKLTARCVSGLVKRLTRD
jgi:hypothetical protein